MTTIAVRQPREYAYSASAEPSSWAVPPIVKASFPLAPKRCGPIWSVVTHGAIVRIPWLMNSCVAAAPYSTSQVSIAILAPCWISWAAHDFCFFSWWLQTLITKLGPPAAASFFASICAPASAGESNGFMLLVRSTAAPITIVGPLELFPAAVVTPTVVATATAASASRAIPNLRVLMCPPCKRERRTIRLLGTPVQWGTVYRCFVRIGICEWTTFPASFVDELETSMERL